jgi:hypothetical protein
MTGTVSSPLDPAFSNAVSSFSARFASPFPGLAARWNGVIVRMRPATPAQSERLIDLVMPTVEQFNCRADNTA